MADEALLAALAGATLGEPVERPGDGLTIALALPVWCGRPPNMPARLNLAIEGLVDRAAVQTRLTTLDERAREIVSIAERNGHGARRRLAIVLIGGGEPVLVDCRDYAITPDA